MYKCHLFQEAFSNPSLPPPTHTYSWLELTYPFFCPSIVLPLYFSSSDFSKLPSVLEAPEGQTSWLFLLFTSLCICEPSSHISRIDFSLFSLAKFYYSFCKIGQMSFSTGFHFSCLHTVSLTFLRNLRHLHILLLQRLTLNCNYFFTHVSSLDVHSSR